MERIRNDKTTTLGQREPHAFRIGTAASRVANGACNRTDQINHSDSRFGGWFEEPFGSFVRDQVMVKADLVPLERVERAILLLRGHRVLLDADLAEMYGVETRSLVQAVKRNRDRFPEDFMFQLQEDEVESLRSQIVILKTGRGRHRKYLPFAFSEQGVAMLSTVLRSPRAVQVNIEIMRAFVRFRQMLQANAGLARKLAALETKYDGQFRAVFDAIRELMASPVKARKRIGFRVAGGVDGAAVVVEATAAAQTLESRKPCSGERPAFSRQWRLSAGGIPIVRTSPGGRISARRRLRRGTRRSA